MWISLPDILDASSAASKHVHMRVHMTKCRQWAKIHQNDDSLHLSCPITSTTCLLRDKWLTLSEPTASHTAYLRTIIIHNNMTVITSHYVTDRMILWQFVHAPGIQPRMRAFSSPNLTAFDRFHLTTGTESHPVCVCIQNFEAPVWPRGHVNQHERWWSQQCNVRSYTCWGSPGSDSELLCASNMCKYMHTYTPIYVRKIHLRNGYICSECVCICMHICIYVRSYACMHVCRIYIYIYTYMHTHINKYMHTHAHTYVYTRTCVRTNVHI